MSNNRTPVPYEKRQVAQGQAVSVGVVAVMAFIVWLLSWSPLLIVGAAGAYAYNRFMKATGN